MRKNVVKVSLILIVALGSCNVANKKDEAQECRPLTPIMGWASWNNYRVHISEDIIKAQADAMVSSGLKNAGYNYINVDDGFFGGRDENGRIIVHPKRFPSGMKSLAEYIHQKGLKAGIYSDAGINTCATHWDKDTIGAGMGLYGHEYQDLELMLKEWGYDFLKVDWCGGEWLGLDEQVRYTEISNIVRSIDPSVVFNICRWKFPGEWAVNVADSWRISPDIANTFESVMKIVDMNADLWRYAGPGHVNDMDMLQIGRGMTYEEDKTHFTMWCMMCSPLLAGNDLTTMSEQTLDILTNKNLIAVNQDPLVYQARRIVDVGDLEVWAKPLVSTTSGMVAVTLLNRSKDEKHIAFALKDVGIDTKEKYATKDLWTNEFTADIQNDSLTYLVKPHGVVALKIEGASLPINVFQFQ